MKYALPVIAAKEVAIDNGSYVEWTGNPMDPMLNFKATDRIRASVSEGENGGTRSVNFDVSIVVKNRLDNLSFAFDVSAPEDATIQNELTAMGAEERGKQAFFFQHFGKIIYRMVFIGIIRYTEFTVCKAAAIH